MVSGTATVSLNILKKDPCAPTSGTISALALRHACVVFVAEETFPWRTIELSTFRNTFAVTPSAFSPRLICAMRWVVASRVAPNPGWALNVASVIEGIQVQVNGNHEECNVKSKLTIAA